MSQQSSLTGEERDVFEALTSGRYTNLGLVRSKLDGEEVAVIAAVNEHPFGFQVTPLAVLVTHDMFQRLEAPEGTF